ncbi:MAG: PHP domain-containing protein, partial [Tenericutes bacterium]|nr:PHP domain-containing protein [Mycoplasmatota bacterium]
MKYIPLNIKTEYELMNSLIKIDDLILYAKNNNINTLGITDSNMFGVIEFVSKCKKNNIKPIVGIEIIIDNKKIYLYAKNNDGYTSLCKIVTEKHLNEISIEYIKKYNDNLICVCNYKDYNLLKESFYEIFVYYSSEEEKKNALIVTKDVLYFPLINYFNESDSKYFKYIRLIDESKTINDEIEFYKGYFLNNNNLFDIKTTHEFSALINIVSFNSSFHIPIYNDKSKEYLRALSKKGLEKRLNNNVPDIYKKRLTYELSIIENMNYVDYFLIVYDFILFAKKRGILVGPGRGSGAASLVNYALGIINVDPLKYDLIFERFLNPDRISMPDIDIDFDSAKREEVIEYVSNKYGKKNTARIISFNTLLPKQVIRDVGKVLMYESLLIDRLCKTIKDEKDFDALKENKDFMNLTYRNND